MAIADSGRAHDRLHPAIVEMRNMPGSGNLLGHRACSIQKVAVDSCAAVSLWARAARSTPDWCIERAGPSEQWRRTWSVAFMKHRLPGLVSPRGSKRRPPAPAAIRSASAASALRFGKGNGVGKPTNWLEIELCYLFPACVEQGREFQYGVGVCLCRAHPTLQVYCSGGSK